ncbi:hypothetical protein DAT35_46560 [Vitiosangium sp. GDMCC 1.1324]|nr:hypothetical protein DAT35_46560 [Vitiosangium sp. GDMCC 1.1324]
MRSILSSYRDQHDQPIASATLIRFADRSWSADLTEDEIERVFGLTEALAFSGLAEREFFTHSGYCNRDSFTGIVQRFRPGASGASLRSRRRDGGTSSYWSAELLRVRQEPHIVELRGYAITALTAPSFNAMETDEGFDLAIRAFNEANTDRATMSQTHELISTVSAFQQLFGIRGGDVASTARSFADALTRVPLASVKPKKPRSEEFVARRGLRQAWMYDMATMRGSVAHGNRQGSYPSIWSVQEHLLLAAFIFPLLVKLRLSASGYTLTREDRLELGLFDYYLASENVLAPANELDGVATSHVWSQLRANLWLEIDIDW